MFSLARAVYPLVEPKSHQTSCFYANETPSWALRAHFRRKERVDCQSWSRGGRVLEEVIKRTRPVDLRARPGNWGLPTPSPFLGMYVLLTIHTVGVVSRTQPWDSHVLLRLTGQYTRLNPGPCINFEESGGRLQRSTHLAAPKASLVRKFPCLCKLPPTHLMWSASVSPCPLCMGTSFRFHPGSSWVFYPAGLR